MPTLPFACGNVNRFVNPLFLDKLVTFKVRWSGTDALSPRTSWSRTWGSGPGFWLLNHLSGVSTVSVVGVILASEVTRVVFFSGCELCWSGVLGAIGVVTLTKVKHRRELLFAGLPLLFAIHQFMEGFVWLGLERTLSPAVRGRLIDVDDAIFPDVYLQ